MEFRILGPVEVWKGGRSLPLGGAKQRALLAILLTQANQVVPADRLIDLIWPGEPPDTAGHSLQVYASELRKVLEPTHRAGTPHAVLVSQAPGYLIRVEGEDLDLNRFQRLVEEGRQSISVGAPDIASTKLREALGLWRGPALADFESQPFALSEIARLHEARLRALEDRIDADLALGRHADLVGELESLIGQHPLREGFSKQLMLALYRSGRQAEASDVYQRARERLVEELGMEPGTELQQILKAILNQDAALDLEPKTSPTSKRRHNLPHQLTSFVGRKSDVAELKRLLSQARLVTLTGTGGIGKTRLAIEVAGELADSYRDGVWLVELASLRDPDMVPQSTAATLGVREQPDRALSDSLSDYLRTRQQLLVLDNCEHVIEAAANLVSLLLLNCPDLQILATSREGLSIGGEIAWRVPSLSLPNGERRPVDEGSADNDSMALFVDRAATALGSFHLDAKNGPVVMQVCQRLDGIPLAIELAVGKLKVLSLDQIAGRLSDRFHLLTGGSRTALPRHQTLAATMDWSYDLLPETQQAVLRTSSVFAGGFDLESAEAVCTDNPGGAAEVLDALARLIDKSLLQMAATKGEVRYHLLETIRQYADVKLQQSGETNDVRDRHRDWFLAIAERAEPELRGPHQVKWFERLETDHDNMRAAFEWSMSQDETESALRLASAMGFFWMFHGHNAEGREWLDRALDKIRTPPSALTARATAWAAQLAGDQYDYQRAVTLAQQGLEVFGRLQDHWGIGFCSLILGNQCLGQDELEQASRFFEQSQEHFRLSGSKPDLAKSLDRLGYVKWMKGDYEDAARLLSESVDLSGAIGNDWYAATAMVNLSQVALSQGRLSLASKLLGESLPLLNELKDVYHASIALHHQAIVARYEKDYSRALILLELSAAPLRELGDPVFLNYCLGERGVVRWLQGNLDEALMLLKQSATVSLQLRDKSGCAKWIEALAGVCLEAEESVLAANLFGAAEALREEIGAPSEPRERADHNGQVATLKSRLGRADLEAAWNSGRAEPLESLIASLSERFDGRGTPANGRSQRSKRPVRARRSRAGQRDESH